MKVTDEIWQRFSDYLGAHEMPTLRDALEHALADVPEPEARIAKLKRTIRKLKRGIRGMQCILANVRALKVVYRPRTKGTRAI